MESDGMDERMIGWSRENACFRFCSFGVSPTVRPLLGVLELELNAKRYLIALVIGLQVDWKLRVST